MYDNNGNVKIWNLYLCFVVILLCVVHAPAPVSIFVRYFQSFLIFHSTESAMICILYNILQKRGRVKPKNISFQYSAPHPHPKYFCHLIDKEPSVIGIRDIDTQRICSGFNQRLNSLHLFKWTLNVIAWRLMRSFPETANFKLWTGWKHSFDLKWSWFA